MSAALILAEALKLPADERAALAEQLLDSVDDEAGKSVDEMTDEELSAELERRHQEYLRDPSVAIPWEKAHIQIFGAKRP
jgi:putative addiction module component (TIGR02574 family)